MAKDRSRVVVDHHSGFGEPDPASTVEVTTTHHGLFIAHLILDRHLRTGCYDARPDLYNAIVTASCCFQTAGLRAAQVCPHATVILDRAHFDDILDIIAADERGAVFHVREVLADARAALTARP